MTENQVAVFIVGAGPVGLTLATLLERHEVPFRIIDQNVGPVIESRATDIHARTIELMNLIGLGAEFMKRGALSQAVKFYSGKKVIANIGTEDLDSPFPYILGLPQYDTEQILIDDLTQKGQKVGRQIALESFEQGEDCVQLILQHSDGRRESVKTRWLVGCDGARSSIRKGLGLPFDGLSYEEAFMLADISIRWDLPLDELHIFFSDKGFCNVLPLPGENRVRLFLDVSADKELEPTQELFQSFMDERVPFPCELYNPGWMSRFRVHCRMVPDYQKGNVFLAGDGAHIHSPVGGRGMNMGIHDSFNLAWKLALVHQGHSDASLLESYHVERHEVAKTTLFETDLATRMSMLRNPVMKEIRDQLSSLVMQLPGVEKRMAEVTSNLAVNMRRSPIVGADRSSLLNAELYHHKDTENASIAEWVEFGFGPEAGDRVPDRVFGAENARRRFSTELDGTHHVVMLFDGAASTPEGYLNLVHIAREIRQRYGDVLKVNVVAPLPEVPDLLKNEESLLLDPTGDLHCSFGARAECLYVIRPDNYIGYRSQPADLEKALAYLGKIFSAR